MKRYRITMPTPEQCTAFGLKFEGQNIRTQLWLMGVASATSFLRTTTRFNLILAGRSFVVETNSARMIGQVEDYLSSYGIKVEELPDSPLLTTEQTIARGIPA